MARKSRNGMTFEGVPKSSWDCPIVRWVKDTGDYDEVFLSNHFIQARLTGTTMLRDIRKLRYADDPETMESVHEFIVWFDQGPYEEEFTN